MITSHECHVVANHQSIDCLSNSLCGPTLKKHQSPYNWPFVRGIHHWLQGSHACRDFGKKSGIVICDSRPGNSREFHLFCLEFGKMRASEFFLKLKWWVMYFLTVLFLTVPRRFSSLFASAHVIGLRLGINQSATALDGISAAPGKHMLHMCRKSLVINFFFFRKSPDSIHLNWGGFPKCLFTVSSHHHQSCIIFENGQMVAVENLASIVGHNMAAMFQLW